MSVCQTLRDFEGDYFIKLHVTKRGTRPSITAYIPNRISNTNEYRSEELEDPLTYCTDDDQLASAIEELKAKIERRRERVA